MRNVLLVPLLLGGCGLLPPADDGADTADTTPPVETCNGKDDDGDGEIDEDVADLPTWYADDDADGYGDETDTTTGCDAPGGFIADNTDCDDANVLVNPGVEEDGGNEVDENCDGVVDETCGPHAPAIDEIVGSFDDKYDFGGEIASAMIMELHFTDEDGDVGNVKFQGWVDTEVDGIVDTVEKPDFSFNWITLDDDGTCGIVENGITLTLGADNLVGTYDSVEVAVEVSDALEHWSAPVIVEVPLQ